MGDSRETCTNTQSTIHDDNIIGSPQNETQDELQGTKDPSKQDEEFDTHSPSPASRRTRSAARHKFQARNLSLESVNTSAVLLGKRKEVSDSPVDSDALVSDQIWEGSITVSKPTTPKRLRQIKFWTPELNGHIDLNFRTNPACLIRAIRVSDVGRAIKSTSNTRVSCTEKLDVNQSPPPSASQSIPDITISLPAEHRPDHKEGDADTLPCKSLLLGDDTIQHVLSLLSAQAFSASSLRSKNRGKHHFPRSHRSRFVSA